MATPSATELRDQNRQLLNQLLQNQKNLKASWSGSSVQSDTNENASSQENQIASNKAGFPGTPISELPSEPFSVRSSTPNALHFTKTGSKTANLPGVEETDCSFIDSYEEKLENSGNIRSAPFARFHQQFQAKAASANNNLSKPVKSQKSNLLGYDWIAEMLETNLSFEDRPDEYFEDLRKFRESNFSDCHSVQMFTDQSESYTLPVQGWPLPSYVSKLEVEKARADTEHKCVHLYKMNSRGFAFPVNVNDEGESICPVCKTKRVKDSKTMVRVTVPKALLPEFDRMDSRTKGKVAFKEEIPSGLSSMKYAFDRDSGYCPGDSVGLSKHVVPGWSTARPTCATPATFVDIKSASTNCQT